MWKEYSFGYIKKNVASSVSIMIAAFISALFLSLICSIFYNMWQYDITRVISEEGNWQGRLTGEISDSDLETIKVYPNVSNAVADSATDEIRTVDIRFDNMRDIYTTLPQIAHAINLSETAVSYHETLLSEYMIFDPQDKQPPLLLAFYLVVIFLACVSLILIIHNAFAVSMGARIHQFGILSSVGATPRQISLALLQEAAVLCIFPILLGTVGGIVLCIGFIRFANSIGSGYRTVEAIFQYHPAVWLVTILVSCLTVFLSAWIPAIKISRMAPLEAIRTTTDSQLKRKKRSRLLFLLFGMEGELAGNALKARKSALRTSSISLTLSFLAFSMFLSFMTLSGISTKYTYFERYKDTWDIMVTVKDKSLADFSDLSSISELNGIRSVTAYQKATAYTVLDEEHLTPELKSLGGLPAVAGSAAQVSGNGWVVEMPLLILDDASFIAYCDSVGVKEQVSGAILQNRIWDSVNSNFRYKQFIPFIEGLQSVVLTDATGEATSAEIPILGITTTPPVLREEYANFSLVQILPESLWSKIEGYVNIVEPDTYLRVLALDDTKVYPVEGEIKRLLDGENAIVIENRIQEALSGTEIKNGYMLLVGILCGLLAIIGIANIFSNTLGFLYQRKREFARYLSVGVTPAGIKKILWVEALTIAGRPILITIPLTVLFVAFAVKASYLNPVEFWAALPIVPLLSFILIIFLCVGLAYFIGGKRLIQSDLSESLKNDMMV